MNILGILNSQKQLACHLLELLYNGVSFLFTQNSALLCFWPAKEYFEWIWLCKGSTYNWERQNVAICSLYLALTVACGSCLPSWFAFLPPSPPASYHQFLILPSSHTCVSTFFPSYSHISACPHLISSLFLQSKVHSCLLDSILQAYFQCCAKWLFSSQLLLNICNRKKRKPEREHQSSFTYMWLNIKSGPSAETAKALFNAELREVAMLFRRPSLQPLKNSPAFSIRYDRVIRCNHHQLLPQLQTDLSSPKISITHLLNHVHCFSIHDSQKLETT